MGTLLLAALLSAGINQQPAADKPAGDKPAGEHAAMPQVEGKWLIVYAEEGGRPNRSWQNVPATIKGDTLTYEEEGKERSIQLKFGPHQTVEAHFAHAGAKDGKEGEVKDKEAKDGDKAEEGQHGHHGVYIASQEYLCISLTGHHAKPADKEEAKDKEPKKEGDKADEGAEHHSSGSFILILRRQAAGKPLPRVPQP